MRLVVLFVCFIACEGHNILISIPNAAPSETKLTFNVMYELLRLGHQVTVLTSMKPPKEHISLTSIVLPEVSEEGDKALKTYPIFEWQNNIRSLIEIYFEAENKVLWQNKRPMELWKKRKEFDLLITMCYFTEASFPFLIDNAMPHIQFCSTEVEGIAVSRNGNRILPSVLSSVLTLYDEHMNFWERALNLPSTLSYHYSQKKSARKYTEVVTELFPDIGDIYSYHDNVSFTLINGHHTMDGSVPLLPNEVEVGGLHIVKPKPLPKDLNDFIEGSGDAGVIYFSLGTIAKSSDILPASKAMFLDAFKKLPQRVLWKYEEDDIKLPPNVMVKKWMPQQDILAHQKTKVFISHCGNLGIQEAKYFGVPILGLPVFFDQPRNAAKLERKNYALILKWEELTTEKIFDSLKTLINDHSYQKRMNELSKIVQDQKETPLERAVWWIEYVLRHKGAKHLTFAGRNLSTFQYFMLDVLLFYFSILATVIFVAFCIIRKICCRKTKLKQS